MGLRSYRAGPALKGLLKTDRASFTLLAFFGATFIPSADSNSRDCHLRERLYMVIWIHILILGIPVRGNHAGFDLGFN